MDQGLFFYYLLPLWCPIIVIGLLALGLDKLGMRLSIPVARVVFGTIYAGLCGGLYWQFLRTPGVSSLVLHELGFRFKETIVLFEELRSIRFGSQLSTLASAVLSTNQFLGRVSRRNAAAAGLMEKGRDGSVTLVFKDGGTKTLGGMLIRPRPADLKQFLERLSWICPDLVEETVRASPAAPAVDKPRLKMTPL